MKRILGIILVLIFPMVLWAEISPEDSQPKEENKDTAKTTVATSTPPTPTVKKVTFNPGKRNPFLSQEEVTAIEQNRKAEMRRREEEKARQMRLAQEEKERLVRLQIEMEERKRYPAREIMDKIRIDGILGNEAIVNSEVVGIGSVVMGAQVVSVTDDSVWFLYKGQRFQRKLPLL